MAGQRKSESGKMGGSNEAGKGASTREQLLAAALKLLHSGGETALSTVSVTKATGLVQSAFYRHFSSVDEIMTEASERVAKEIREGVVAARSKLHQSGPAAIDDLIQFYLSVFELTEAARPMMELFLRYRSDPMALGGVMHRLAQDLRDDLAQDLLARGEQLGLEGLPPEWISSLADHLVSTTLSALEARFEGRGLDAEGSARLLAGYTNGACLGVLDALGIDAFKHFVEVQEAQKSQS